MTTLPIDPVFPQLLASLEGHTRCLLQAAPGAGKTTRVPLTLLEAPWLEGQKILMLEPRRIAARSAARYMAGQRNEPPGETVGYRLRLDRCVTPRTRLEVVTEGILTRMIQDDPALEGVGCVILDEFHERNLQGDLALALLLQAQSLLREDLRILVMSATLDSEPLLQLLGPETPVIHSEGRSYPVQTRYLGGRPLPFDPGRIATALSQAAAETTGDLLCFLPGQGEIRRVQQRLGAATLPADVEVRPLYGGLSVDHQDAAIAPSPSGRRKLVLATAIAETSLTIEGVTTVVDAGLMRLPRFAPRSGMTRLETRPVSQASATQRQGRAGRLQAGHCYRLWSEEYQLQLEAHTPPEIQQADLAPLALELALWGCDADELAWIDPPPAVHLAQARELLQGLEALDDQGRITDHGRALATLGTHPRLAHMMLKARTIGLGGLACDLAALLSERSPSAGQGCDLRQQLEQLWHSSGDRALNAARQMAKRWRGRLNVASAGSDSEPAGLLLAFAFPDRIGRQRRSGSRQYLLSNGRGAEFREPDPLCTAEFLVAADLDGQGRNARIYQAAPLSKHALEQHFAAQMERRCEIGWDDAQGTVRGRSRLYLKHLLVEERPLPELTPEQRVAGLLQGIRVRGLASLPWDRESRTLQARVELLRRHDAAGWPDFSDMALVADLEQWLAPYLGDQRRLEGIKRLPLKSILLDRLSWEQQQTLAQAVPTHIRVPSGSNLAIDYLDAPEPTLAARIQELFGWQQSPTILNGRLPLTLHLLSPARRPIQVTRDLASFWANTYAEVCKDLKGRYPKHYWPSDPFTATATAGTKKQMDKAR
ncbi:ATP-dependent helicase HrpB [Motiliproteus sp. SC1-56]|uniref:ATP-dependent helicase HrpB n=1 Tax=Motiliproteus sp. SC1-56 TaxID=2799565 RepID=UPI001A8C2E1C|nr:ATP-dependent helicase HrpB [Motiliproteus sp. SC1-56]